MDRHKHYIVVPIHQFHYLMDTALVIGHLDQTAKYAHTMVDMDDVIT